MKHSTSTIRLSTALLIAGGFLTSQAAAAEDDTAKCAGLPSQSDLGLYASGHALVGGVGVSGDTSCADHHVAWRVRSLLNLDHLGASGSNPAVGGVSGDPSRPDNIVYDITANPQGGTGVSAGGFGHPTCMNTGNQLALPVVRP